MNKIGSVNYLNIGSRIEKIGLTKIPPSTTIRSLLGCSVLSQSVSMVYAVLLRSPTLPYRATSHTPKRYEIVSNKYLLFMVT